MRALVRYAGALIALGALAGSLVLSLALLLGSEREPLVLATAFAPWAVLGYTVALLILLLGWRGASGIRRRLVGVGVVLSLAGIVLHAARIAPAFVGEHATGDPDLTVMALNMEYGRADIGTTARLVEREQPDVIVLSEATPEAVQALADRGMGGTGSRWPHQGGEALPGVFGTVVLSSYPIASSATLEIRTGAHRMRVQAPTPFWLTAVHTTQPVNATPQWRSDFEVLTDDARTVTGPRLAVGDFNATLDHAPMRRLLDTGLRSAAEEANSGWQPTWPTAGSRTMGGVPVPFRLMAIDHVLLSRQLSAVSTEVASVPNTDHHAVIARVVFRDAP